MARNNKRTESSLRKAFGELLPPAEELRSSLNSPTAAYPPAGRTRSLKTAAIATAGVAATVAVAAGLLLLFGAFDFSPNRGLLEGAATGITRTILDDSSYLEEDPVLAFADELSKTSEWEIDAIHSEVAEQFVAGSRSPASQ